MRPSPAGAALALAALLLLALALSATLPFPPSLGATRRATAGLALSASPTFAVASRITPAPAYRAPRHFKHKPTPGPTILYCTLRAGVDSQALHLWHPDFSVGSPGAPCVFPFFYNGTEYTTCAQITPKDKTGVRTYGWCFSDPATLTFGACACTSSTVPPSPPTLKPTTSTARPTPSTAVPTDRPSMRPTSTPTMRPSKKPFASKHPSVFPTTLAPTSRLPPRCVQVGNGPVHQSNTTCDFPFFVQLAKNAPAQEFSYCVQTSDIAPWDYMLPGYQTNKTAYWCAVTGKGGVYQPYNKQIALQWAWCACDGPPQDAASWYLAQVNPAELSVWKPSFVPGVPGSPCVFPFTWQGTTYYECAEIDPINRDPVRRMGWCFSDPVNLVFGACGSAPPTLKPTIPTPLPTSRMRTPFTHSPVYRPTTAPVFSSPTMSPSLAPSVMPTQAPIGTYLQWQINLVIAAPTPVTSQPTSQPVSLQGIGRRRALDARTQVFTFDNEAVGLACLLIYAFFSDVPVALQPLMSVSFVNDTFAGSIAVWPKIAHVYIFSPLKSDAVEYEKIYNSSSIETKLQNPSADLFTPGLWLGGNVVYSTSNANDELFNLTISGAGLKRVKMVQVPPPAVCTSAYLDLSVLRHVSPAPIPFFHTPSPTDTPPLSSGAIAGVIIGIVLLLLLLAAFLFVAWKRGWITWALQRVGLIEPGKANTFVKGGASGGGGPSPQGGGGPSGAAPGLRFKAYSSSSWNGFWLDTLKRSRSAETTRAMPLETPSPLAPQSVSPPPKPVYLNEFSIDLSELRLIKVIGHGGNGQIFKGEYAGSAVAVKELFALPGSDSGVTVDVLFREYDNLRVLKHPHIIQIFGLAVARSAETESPRYLLVMELADTSLDKVMLSKAEEKARGIDTQPWALEVAKQAASGLAFIHDKGFIHFDVKPHNVLLDKSGTVKLCDLGISRLAHGDKTDAPLAGTPSYMAPELIRGRTDTVGPPVDVYAYGIVLWQLFHFMPPYPKDWTVARLFDEVLKGLRPIIDTSCMTAPLQALTQSCWSEDPSERPTFKRILSELAPLTLAAAQAHHVEVETQTVEAVRYNNGDRVRVYSAAVRALVPGTVKIPPEKQTGPKQRFYDVLLNDGSLMVGVNESDLFPPVSQRSPHEFIGSLNSSNPLGLNSTSTLADLASALAVEKRGGNAREPIKSPAAELAKKGGRRRFLQRLWKLPHQASDSDNESLVENAPTPLGSLPASPQPKGKRRARLSMDERSMLGLGETPVNDDTRRSLEDVNLSLAEERNLLGSASYEPSSFSPSPNANVVGTTATVASNTLSSGTRTPGVSLDMHALPAITPFSFRFLPVVEREEKSVTFRYDGAKLSLPGMVLSSRSMAVADSPLPEELKDAEAFKKGSVRITELGRGASGVVYSALVLSTFQIVAVKEVRFGDRSARHQVVRELNALSRMQSPYIVKMLAAHLDSSSECVALVLEYINGGSLQDFINFAKGSKLLAEQMLTNIAHDVVHALAYCHEMGMVHLDVKPSNILLGLDGTAKLADFGLARQIELNKMAATFVGTTKYLSPERLRGTEYSFSADIWGLGMCLLAAALGKYPFEDALFGRNEQGVYWSLLERLETGPMPTLPTDSFSFAARRFCNSCLALDPKLRPTAAALMKDDWLLHRTEVPVQKTPLTREASIMVLGEVCEAIVRYLARSETTFVSVDPRLVSNLAAQIGLTEAEVRLAFEATASRQATTSPTTIRSSTDKGDNSYSRRSLESLLPQFVPPVAASPDSQHNPDASLTEDSAAALV